MKKTINTIINTICKIIGYIIFAIPMLFEKQYTFSINNWYGTSRRRAYTRKGAMQKICKAYGVNEEDVNILSVARYWKV